MDLNLKISKVTIIKDLHGPDEIYLHLEGLSPYPVMKYPGFAKIQTAAGYAEEYCKNVLGISEYEIIHAYPK